MNKQYYANVTVKTDNGHEEIFVDNLSGTDDTDTLKLEALRIASDNGYFVVKVNWVKEGTYVRI